MKNPKFSGKLTKQFLFSLPEGLYLASNVMEAPGQPLFAETIRPPRDRAAQWQAIVAARANHRNCHVFENPADFLAFSL